MGEAMPRSLIGPYGRLWYSGQKIGEIDELFIADGIQDIGHRRVIGAPGIAFIVA